MHQKATAAVSKNHIQRKTDVDNLRKYERKRIAPVDIPRKCTPLFLRQWQDCGSVRSQASSIERHSRYRGSTHVAAIDQRKIPRSVLGSRAERTPEKDSECYTASPSGLGLLHQVAWVFGVHERFSLGLDRGRRRSFHLVVALAASETVFLAFLPGSGSEIRLLAST